MITERENFFRMARRETPAFVSHQPGLLQMVLPSALRDRGPSESGGRGQDWFGTWWTTDESMPTSPVPDPAKPYVLDDITEWESVIAWPDLSRIDWAACAARDLPEGREPSKILCLMLVSGPFERLHDLMGFENALISLITEPEACHAFFRRLCDFKIEQLGYLKRYYDPDMVHFQDDWGNQKDLFFDPALWREIIAPEVRRVVEAAHELGLLFDMHSCGRIDRVADDIVSWGVDVLDPAQPVNDLERWAREYNGKLIIMGGLNAQDIIDNASATDAEIRAETRRKLDLFATGGYYIPFAVSLSPRLEVAFDEVLKYGREFYGRQTRL
ncbi:MAG: hypothetical protein LBN99_03255 [Oscillospiraceae bacterium]|jgi:uroporphyrinogen decarboxylase|nr:hypothetical protein [Oscillospiraceae bacterium]